MRIPRFHNGIRRTECSVMTINMFTGTGGRVHHHVVRNSRTECSAGSRHQPVRRNSSSRTDRNHPPKYPEYRARLVGQRVRSARKGKRANKIQKSTVLRILWRYQPVITGSPNHHSVESVVATQIRNTTGHNNTEHRVIEWHIDQRMTNSTETGMEQSYNRNFVGNR